MERHKQSSRLLLVAFSLAVAPAQAQFSIEPQPVRLFTAASPKTPSNGKKWWVLSGVALTAASMVDFGTSVGHNETNPALRSFTGQFSIGRGISIKLGLAGATMLFQ